MRGATSGKLGFRGERGSRLWVHLCRSRVPCALPSFAGPPSSSRRRSSPLSLGDRQFSSSTFRCPRFQSREPRRRKSFDLHRAIPPRTGTIAGACSRNHGSRVPSRRSDGAKLLRPLLQRRRFRGRVGTLSEGVHPHPRR